MILMGESSPVAGSACAYRTISHNSVAEQHRSVIDISLLLSFIYEVNCNVKGHSGRFKQVKAIVGAFRCSLMFISRFYIPRKCNVIFFCLLFHRFGWFGISAEHVSRPILNYCGAGLCLLR